MTRGEMRTQLRYDALDPNTTTWVDARLDAQLNTAALYVFNELQSEAPITLAHATTTFTSATGTLEYTLSPTNIAFIRQAYATPATNSDPKIPLILEGDLVWEKQVQEPCFDTYWKAGLRRLATANQYQIIFDAPGAGDRGFTVEYVAQPSDIATGGGDDTSIYTSIPYQYHLAVVARAVWQTCGPDRSLTAQARENFLDLMRQAKTGLNYRKAGPRRVRRN